MSGDFGIFTRARTAYEGTPLARLTEVAMRGNAAMASVTQAKQLASDQMDSNAKTSLTLKDGRVTIKDADPSLIDGTQEQELHDTYNAPHVAVAAQLAQDAPQQAAPAPQAPQSATQADVSSVWDLVDKTVGHHVPRPTDPDIAEKLKTPDGIRALTLEIGGTKDHANRAVHEVAKGILDPKKIAETVSTWRAQNLSNIYQKAVRGPLDEVEQIQKRNQTEADRKATESRLLRSQKDSEQKAVYARHNAINKSIDYSQIDPGPNNENWHKAFDDQNDTGVAATPQQYAAIDRKGAQDINRAFLDFTDTKKNTFHLGNFDSWEAAKSSLEYPLTDRQDRMGRAAWKADHNYVLTERQKANSTEEGKAARLELLHYKIEHEGDVKPVPIGRGDLKDMSVPELLAHDPSKVKDYDAALLQKEGMLRKELQEATERAKKANVDVRSITATPEMQRRWGWQTGLANAQFDAKTYADHATQAQAELQQIQAARASRKGGAATPIVKPSPRPANPTKGQKWQGPTGVQTFDGHGWVQ